MEYYGHLEYLVLDNRKTENTYDSLEIKANYRPAQAVALSHILRFWF